MSYDALARYLIVPKAACESWDYLPIRFSDSIGSGNYWTIMRDAQLYQFGILNSAMHMAWIKCISGRLNCHTHASHHPSIRNFPWPIKHTQIHLSDIEVKALEVLETRARYAHMSLNDLYNPYSMPTDLYRAHFALDKAVDAAYGQTAFNSDQSRVGFLFNLDRLIANLLVSEAIFRPDTAVRPAYDKGTDHAPFPLLTGQATASPA